MAALLYLAILHMHYVAMLECFLCFHNSIFYFANLNIISQSCKYLAKIFLHAAVKECLGLGNALLQQRLLMLYRLHLLGKRALEGEWGEGNS